MSVVAKGVVARHLATLETTPQKNWSKQQWQDHYASVQYEGFGEHTHEDRVTHTQPFYFHLYQWDKLTPDDIEDLVTQENEYRAGTVGFFDVHEDITIDSVIRGLTEQLTHSENMAESPAEWSGEMYGLTLHALSVNAGAMLGAAYAAKNMGCTYGVVNIGTNDGDLSGKFWNREKKLFIIAAGFVYYGS